MPTPRSPFLIQIAANSHPDRRAIFERVAGYERQFGCTIQRARSVRDLADRGNPYAAAPEQPELVTEALASRWTLPIRTSDRRLPVGAYGEAAGPS